MAYDKTIERIDNQPPGFQQLAKQTLSWIVYATRQLGVLELRHALAVEDEATELDEENLAETDEIIHACAGLVTIEQDTSIIRLVHYTTQEYLEHKFLTWEPLAETAITRTCLTYLSFDVMKDNTDALRSGSQPLRNFYRKPKALKNLRFLDYAVDSWHHHAEHCWNDVVEQLILSFLEEDPQVLHYGVGRYMRGNNIDYSVRSEYFRMNGCKSVHFVALFGLARIATALLQAGYNIRVVDGHKRTPLIYAARFGHLAVAKLLLKDVNFSDDKGGTPLYYAAKNGHESIVKLLLSCEGIDVNAQSLKNYDTPLRTAIRNGHEGVVRLLLERDDIDVKGRKLDSSEDSAEDPALITAVTSGYKGILEQLLGRDDVDLNCSDIQGDTALIWAIKLGKFDVVKKLLMREEIDINRQNNQNRTALIWAAELGKCDVVDRLLMRREIDVNCQDNQGRTALIWAAELGKCDVVDRLLMRREIDVNCQDIKGRTALMVTATSMKTTISLNQYRLLDRAIQSFFDRRDIDVNCQNNEGETALMLAAKRNNHSAMKMLLERDDIDRTGYDRVYKDKPYYIP